MNVNFGLSGKYKCIVARNGRTRLETDWQDNMILDSGLDQLATEPDPIAVALIGKGATPVAPGQISLFETVTDQSAYNALGTYRRFTTGAPDYIISSVWTFYFPMGTVNDTIREVGISPRGISSGNPTAEPIFSRMVLSPAITVNSEDQFTLIYKLDVSTTVADTEFELVLSDGTHAGIIRPAFFNKTDWDGVPDWVNDWLFPFQSMPTFRASDDPILDVTTGPSSSGASGASVTDPAYIAGSYEKFFTGVWDATEANFDAGINSVVCSTEVGYWQIGFTPSIVKTNTTQLSLTVHFTWSRL